MMKVYIDEEFKCNTTNQDGAFREVEDAYFDDKCTEYIEGIRYVPENESWKRDDGEVFFGKMISFWKESSELDAAQRAYERQKLADAETALAILLGGTT